MGQPWSPLPPVLLPPWLKPGDKVALVAPSRAVAPEEVHEWIAWMQNRGYRVLPGRHLHDRFHQWSGTDELRALDLQEAVNDPEIRAVFLARGGHGATRLLDKIQTEALVRYPKWIIGYSDATALLNHLLQQTGLVTVHGPMPFQFSSQGVPPAASSEDWELTLSLMEGTLHELSPLDLGQTVSPSVDHETILTGRLIGGNLSVLYSLMGSHSMPCPEGAILLVEDLDEYGYHLDRMWLALRRSGYLNSLAAILVGDFTDIKDHAIPFGLKPLEILQEHAGGLPLQVAPGFPCGHGARNMPLPLGLPVELSTKAGVIQCLRLLW